MNDYERVAAVIRYLDAHRGSPPSLAELADRVGLSHSHFHRLFCDWAGVTPKTFMRCLTLSDAKQRLLAGRSVLTTALESGLSGPGRLHDLCVRLEAASPGEIKSGGTGWTVDWAVVPSPLGNCLLAQSPRGICHLSFVESHGDESSCRRRKTPPASLRSQWPAANWRYDREGAERVVEAAFKLSGGVRRVTAEQGGRLRCLVRGSDFQLRVWRALLQIPAGHLVSYGDIARVIGDPKASRAVGTAVGNNAIAMLIPCHRVIRQTGVIGAYRWGRTRKQMLIARESAMNRLAGSCEKSMGNA